MTENCKSCCFSLLRPGKGGRFCHRRAPTAVSNIPLSSGKAPHAQWPRVEDTEWCGEFRLPPGKLRDTSV